MSKFIENNVKKIIIENLILDEDTRDNDNYLTMRVFNDLGLKLSTEQIIIISQKMPPFESIRRCRQKLQQDNASLRGKKYKLRHKRQALVKKELVYK